MKKEICMSYIVDAIHSYGVNERKNLMKEFLDFGVAFNGRRKEKQPEGALDVSGLDVKTQLEKCIKESGRSLPVFERWEAIKKYNYSVLFNVDDFDSLVMMIASKEVDFATSSFDVYDEFTHPSYLDFNNEISILKFLRHFSGTNPINGEKVFKRYPMIVVFHKQQKIIEVRFESLSRFLMGEASSEFYCSLISQIRTYFSTVYDVIFTPMNLDFLVALSSESTQDVCRIAQSMTMDNGSRAKLDIGTNTDSTIPLIGEMKQLMKEHADKFDESPEIKAILADFICEKEERSEFPSITLRWSKNTDTKVQKIIDVKFTFNYYQEGYCMLYYYARDGFVGMERMNDVVKFIKRNQPDNT